MPKFKTKREKQSFIFPSIIKVKNGKFLLPRIGWIRYFDSRPIEGEIKTATIKKDASGWYISLAFLPYYWFFGISFLRD